MFVKYEKTFRVLIPQIDAKGNYLNTNEVKQLLSGWIVVEEKIDGANVGVIRHKYGFTLQKRGSLVGQSEHLQYNYFHAWANSVGYDRIMALPENILLYGVAYIAVFPIVTFVWFIVLAFFVFLISKDMPFDIALFVSMAIIAVVRILSYYREEAAKEIAKMIPYAILSFLLTSAAVYADPSFFNEKQLGSIPIQFMEKLGGILSAMTVVTIFEITFRITFIVKRKFLPVSEKILEEEVETEVEAITKAHFKKMEEKEKKLENRIDELMNKLKDTEKENS